MDRRLSAAAAVAAAAARCRYSPRNKPLSALLFSLMLLLLQVLQVAVDTLRPNIVEVTLDLIHKLIAFRYEHKAQTVHHCRPAAHIQ
jgi:hypothetical protein